MTCPRCRSDRVTTQDRAYITAHLRCLACGFGWRLVRGSVVPVGFTSAGQDEKGEG